MTCPTTPELRQFDSGIPIDVTILDCPTDAPADLTGATTVTFVFLKPDGTVMEKIGTIVDAANGLVRYNTVGNPSTATGDLDVPGTWKVQVRVAGPGSAVWTSSPATFKVKPIYQ